MSEIFLVAVALFLLFGIVVFRGAPYVPTHQRTIEQALKLLSLRRGDLVVDLGSGDGIFLKTAAKQGQRVVGYEINPILCAVAWIRCWNYRQNVSIKLRDFWLADFPSDAKAIFIFLAGPYMGRLKRKIDVEMKKRDQPLLVVSNGFAIPGVKLKKLTKGLYLYEFNPKT